MIPEQYQAQLELVVADSDEQFAQVGADRVIAAWQEARPGAVLVATGSTPMPVYAELARRAATGRFDARGRIIAQLDEYLGIDEDDARSLFGWMRQSFVEPLGIEADRIVRLRGDAVNPDSECKRFDEAIAAAGGIAFALLGLGPNGHLGFNEPPSASSAATRVVPLSEESLASNRRYWPELPVPRYALTAGLTHIVSAEAVVLFVAGAHKREILERTLTAPESDAVPASHLRRAQHLVVIADRSAAGSLMFDSEGD